MFNAAEPVFKPFLDITPNEVQNVLSVVAAAFSFARGAVQAFGDNDVEEGNGKKGTLIFTGATASLRGGPVTSAFSAGKNGVRALSQSLAKEFGKENIHVAHVSVTRLFLFAIADIERSPSLMEVILYLFSRFGSPEVDSTCSDFDW